MGLLVCVGGGEDHGKGRRRGGVLQEVVTRPEVDSDSTDEDRCYDIADVVNDGSEHGEQGPALESSDRF